MSSRLAKCFAIVVLPVSGEPFMKMMHWHERPERAGIGTNGRAVSMVVVMAQLHGGGTPLIRSQRATSSVVRAAATISATIQYDRAQTHQAAKGMTAARRHSDAGWGRGRVRLSTSKGPADAQLPVGAGVVGASRGR